MAMPVRPSFRPTARKGDVLAQIEDIWNAITTLTQTVPTGALIPWIGNAENIPPGYLFCDGADRYGMAKYPALGKLLKNRFGGDGTTTFAVPDLRDTFLVGAAEDPSADDRVGTFSAITIVSSA